MISTQSKRGNTNICKDLPKKEDSYFEDIISFEKELMSSKFRSVLHHKYLARLKNVSFFSTMNYFENTKIDHSRYEHSLGVAFLAMLLAEKLSISETEKDLIILSALLHDVGHTPLSHATEVFVAKNSNRYHQYHTRNLLSKSAFKEMLPSFNLDESQTDYYAKCVKKILSGTCKEFPTANLLFSNAISLDSLDASARSRYTLYLDFVNPVEVINLIEENENNIVINFEACKILDKFWEYERELYWDYIYTTKILAGEAMLTRALELTIPLKDLHRLHEMNDEDLWSVLSTNEEAGYLSEMVRNGIAFMSIRESDNGLFDECTNESEAPTKKNRTECSKHCIHKDAVNKVRDKYGLDPVFIILHSSFVRTFRGTSPKQLSFLDRKSAYYGSDKLDFETFVSHYRKGRVNDVRQDIFIPPDVCHKCNS